MGTVDATIVAFRSRKGIEAAVRSAFASEAVGRVVVVDHGEDGSGTLAEAAGAAVIAEPSNPGFAAGQNRAIRETTAEFVLVLNPDAVLLPGALDDGLRILLEEPRVAGVQGTITRPGGVVERSAGRDFAPVHFAGRALGLRHLLGSGPARFAGRRLPAVVDHVERRREEVSDVAWLAATALLVRRSAFDEVGGFDERYHLYGEDFDLCRRLRSAGWRLATLPCDWAAHQGSASSSDSVDRDCAYWAGMMRYAAKWWPARWWAQALFWSGVEAVKLSVRRPSSTRRIMRSMLAVPARLRSVGGP